MRRHLRVLPVAADPVEHQVRGQLVRATAEQDAEGAELVHLVGADDSDAGLELVGHATTARRRPGLRSLPMANLLIGAVAAVVTGWLLHELAKGGRRWRALTVANRELEVAQRLEPGSDLERALTMKAHGRIERYLRPRDFTRWTATANLVVTALTALAAGVGAFLLLEPHGFWASLVTGLTLGAAYTALEVVIQRPLLARLLPGAGTPPAPPAAPAAAARPRAPDDPAPPEPPQPAGRRPTPPT